MGKKCVLTALWLVAGMFTFSVFADVNTSVTVAQTSLNNTLVSLKQSVTRLSLENEEIGRLNESLRGQIKNVTEELAVLQREDTRTEEQYQALDATYKQKLMALKTLEERVIALDKLSSDAGREANQILTTLQVKEEEEAQVVMVSEVLAEQVRDLRERVAEPVAFPAAETVDQHKLARDLATTEASLTRVREEWLALQRLIEGGPGQLESLKLQNASIREEIQQALNDLPRMQASLAEQEDFVKRFSSVGTDNAAMLVKAEQEVRGLSDEITALQQELSRLDKERDAKARKAREIKSADAKGVKAGYDELKIKNFALREELKKLRQSMIAMDKKKAGLEKELYGPLIH